MSVNYEEREQQFKAGIEACFKHLGDMVVVEAQEIRGAVVIAYKQDLQALDAKARILDDIVTIVKTGDADDGKVPENKYRKIRQVLVAKDLVEN